MSQFGSFKSRRRTRQTSGVSLTGEASETRQVLSAVYPAVTEPVPNDTVDTSADLGTLEAELPATAFGNIGDTPDLGADVDWYKFTVSQISRLTITATAPIGRMDVSVHLSLYNSTPFEFDDPLNRLGHRRIAQSQDQDQSPTSAITRLVAPGDYFIAVSGIGNLDFHSQMVGSGYPGKTDGYQLSVLAVPVFVEANAGPQVLATEPESDSEITSSPLVIRIGLSDQIDPATVFPDETVRVIRSGNSLFGDADDVSVPLSITAFSSGAKELQLTPAAPLPPGNYGVFLFGDELKHSSVIRDLAGVPLGANQARPSGIDQTTLFRIIGAEGRAGATTDGDDTAATAHDLGQLTEGNLLRVQGAVGDDPWFDPSIDWLMNPSNDVDMYRFQLEGAGSFAATAEVFAGRIGSPLDSGVALYRRDPATDQLVFVTGNNNTFNGAVDVTGWNSPLYTDSALFTGLTAGEYFVAVSSGSNTPAPAELQLPGSEGLLNPDLAHSALYGNSTGPYVLNLYATKDGQAPTVVSTTPEPGQILTSSPERLTVRFSEPVSLLKQAFEAYRSPDQSNVSAVYIESSNGQRYFPRLQSADSNTFEVSFLMLDRLPDGLNTLHLSGALGLTDMAGLPLQSNDVSGDYVIPFEVVAEKHPVVVSGLSTNWNVADLAGVPDGQTTTYSTGTLFPREWQGGITISRMAESGLTSERDIYRFTTLQTQDYLFTVEGQNLPDDLLLEILDLDNNPVPGSAADARTFMTSGLPAGTYFFSIGEWDLASAKDISYLLHLNFLNNHDNPPPLTSGPAPAIQVRLSGTDSSKPSAGPAVAAVSDRPPQVIAATSGQTSANSSSYTYANFFPGFPARTAPVSNLTTRSSGPDVRIRSLGEPVQASVVKSSFSVKRQQLKVRGKLNSINGTFDSLKDDVQKPATENSDEEQPQSAGETEPNTEKAAEGHEPRTEQSAAYLHGPSLPNRESERFPKVTWSNELIDIVFANSAHGEQESASNTTPAGSPEDRISLSASGISPIAVSSDKSSLAATILSFGAMLFLPRRETRTLATLTAKSGGIKSSKSAEC